MKFLSTLVALPAVFIATLLLRVCTSSWWIKTFIRSRAMRGENGPYRQYLGRVFQAAVFRAARVVPGASCVAQTLALSRILRALRIAHEINVGASPSACPTMHAWIEIEAVEIASRDRGFTPFRDIGCGR
jgi:Transglutaminase-like superfamily